MTERAATKLVAVGSREAFCATSLREGCTRTCVPAPAWSAGTPTFAHVEVWAHADACPDDALGGDVNCTIAVEVGGTWYAAVDEMCKRTAAPAMITGLAMEPVRSRGGLDVFAYTIEGEVQSMDERNGERVDSSVVTKRRFILPCGVGPSRVPSCLEPILVGDNGLGDEYTEQRWSVEDGRGFSVDASRFRVVLP